MSVSVAFIRELENIDPKFRNVLLKMLEEIERQREDSVTKKEFNELKEIVRDLGKTVKELAEAQKKTEQRLDRLEKTVHELAEAQKKTEQKLNELAEAQKKTEEELKKLISDNRKTREQLGGLAHTVGYVLEDRSYRGLPPLLKRDFGVEITEPLKRDYIEVAPNKYLEVNILGKAKRNGEDVWIVGEAKTQLKKRDIDTFIKRLSSIKEHLKGEIVPVIVTYQTPPPIRKYAQKKNIKIYFSYEFPV